MRFSILRKKNKLTAKSLGSLSYQRVLQSGSTSNKFTTGRFSILRNFLQEKDTKHKSFTKHTEIL